MSARPPPVRILLWLLALAAAISGWVYGWHWKGVATGSKPTREEKLIMDLQDQLDLLRAENERLAARINTAAAADEEPVKLPSQK